MKAYLSVIFAAGAFLIAVTCNQAYAEGGKLLISNHADASITVVDTDLLEIEGEIQTGKRPADLAASSDGTRVYSAIYGAGEVLAIDRATFKAVGMVKAGARPYAIDLTSDGRYLAVVDSSEKGDISVIDTASMKVTRKTQALQMPIGLKISPDGKLLFVTNGEGMAQIFNFDDLTLVKEISMPSEVYAIAFSGDGSKIYFKSVAEQEIVILDAVTLEQAGRMAADNIDGLVFSNDGKEIWYGGPEGFVTVYSLVENRILAKLEAGCYQVFQDIAFSPDGRLAFVSPAGEDGKSVMVFDAATKEVVKQITLPKRARNLLYLK